MTTIGCVPGFYGLIPVGHLNIVEHAAQSCDRTNVSVVTGDVLKGKEKAPVFTLAERLSRVRTVRYRDGRYRPRWGPQLWSDLFDKGGYWRGTEKGEALDASLATAGTQVEYFPCTLRTSYTPLWKLISV